MSDLSPDKYITKAWIGEADLSEENWGAALKKLNGPLEAKSGDGGAEKAEFERVPLDAIGEQRTRFYIDWMIAQHNLSREKMPFMDVANWSELRNIHIGLLGQRVDISALLPGGGGGRIFYCPMPADLSTGAASYENRTVYFMGNITTLLAALTILHEVGHLHDGARLERLGKDALVAPGEYSKHAEKLRRERSATAFAFKILRSILGKDPETKKAAFAFLKNYALQSYYSSVRSSVATNEAMRRHFRSEADWWNSKPSEDEERYRAWEEWRTTPAYDKWKIDQKEQLEGAEDYEEFWIWREWVEKTGYEYWNDIEQQSSQSQNS